MDRQENYSVETPAWPVVTQTPLPPAGGPAPAPAPTWLSTQVIDGDDRLMAGLAHASIWLNLVTGFLGLAVAGGIWLVYRNRNDGQWVAGQALQATFWQLGVLAAMLVGGASMWLGAHLLWTIIGLLFFPLACLAGFAIIVMFLYSLYSALQGFSGRDFRYPIVGVAADPL